MKTVKGLHEKMGTFENANTSFHQAAKCKRYTDEVHDKRMNDYLSLSFDVFGFLSFQQFLQILNWTQANYKPFLSH